MSRTVTSLGGPPPALPRTKTFASNFADGLDHSIWSDKGYAWHYKNGQSDGSYDEQTSGQQTIINEEFQYYLKESELTGTVPEWPDNKPWFIRNGNLVLSAIAVPSQYDNIAWGIVEGYTVVSSTSNSVRVQGRSYYDRNAQASRFGLNRYMTDGRPLRIVSGGQVYDVSSVTHHNGSPDPATGPTEHTINISGTFAASPSGSVNLLRKQKYVSGMVTSRKGFSQKYGSWQMRAKFPKGKGTFAAIWSWSNYLEFNGTNFSNAEKSPEIDFIESLGHATDIAYHNLHQPDYDMEDYAVGKTALDHSNSSPQTPGWTRQNIQQHQVLMDPSNPDYYDIGDEFVDARWDWYPSNVAGVVADTCALYVKRDSWSDFRKVYESYMSPVAANGVIDERKMIINMAMEGAFNFEQERNDANYPRLTGVTPSPWEFEVEYIDVYQWDGNEAGAAGLPDINGAYPNGLGGTVNNGVITGPTTPTVSTRQTRDTAYIGGPDEMESLSTRTFPTQLPEGATNPDLYTFAHTVTGDADVSIVGPDDEFELTVTSNSGDDLNDRTFQITTVVTAI